MSLIGMIRNAGIPMRTPVDGLLAFAANLESMAITKTARVTVVASGEEIFHHWQASSVPQWAVGYGGSG